MDYVKFADIRPASYNPRKITDEAFVELQGSLKTLGFILPIIVNRDNMTIVAGHQRTKAATAVGLTEAPVYFISGVDIESEILFNQVHNGVELEPEKLSKCKASREAGTFHDDIPASDFEIVEANASIVKDICRLIVKFGDALCAIVCGDEWSSETTTSKLQQLSAIPFIATSSREASVVSSTTTSRKTTECSTMSISSEPTLCRGEPSPRVTRV